MFSPNNISQQYKHTDLGFIPIEWRVITFGEIGTFSKGAGISRAEANTGSIPCVRYGELYTHHNDYIKTYNSFISKKTAKKATTLKTGDILFAASGETKEDIGKSVAFIDDIEAYAGGDIIILSTNQFICHPKYIGYVSNAPFVTKQKAVKGQGDAVVHITTDSVKSIIIPLPPLPEQRAIADALSDVDDLITALDKKIAKKRLIKQGVMQQLLTGKKRLPGFTEKWVEKKLGELVKITKGSTLTSDKFKIGNIPVIAGGKTPAGFHCIANRPAHTITISASGASAGYVSYYEEPIFATDCSTIEPDNTYEIKYIYQLLSCHQACIYKLQTGGAQPHVHPSDINEMSVLITQDIYEQQAIAAILSDMDKEITNLEAQRDKYCLLKSGMMQKLLIGQIRLTKPQTLIQPLLPNVIAGHIVNTLYQSQGWGRTKLQKALHLSSYYSQADLGACYIRNTAGPDDQSFMNQIDLKFKQYHHVEVFPNITLDGKKHYVYRPTEDIHILEKVYDGYPEITRQKINFILSRMSSWDLAQSEIISTLYAVWNNRIIKNLPISDDLLLTDFYKWSEHKSEYSSAKVLKMLDYMRKENIIPIGWGKYIEDREDW